MNKIRITKDEKPYSLKVELIDKEGNALGVLPVGKLEYVCDANDKEHGATGLLTLTIPGILIERFAGDFDEATVAYVKDRLEETVS